MKRIFIGLDVGDVHLNLNDAGINAKHRCAQGLIEHEGALAAEPLSSSHHVQPTMTNEDGAADCTLGGHDTGPSREPAATVVTRGATDEPSATDPSSNQVAQ